MQAKFPPIQIPRSHARRGNARPAALRRESRDAERPHARSHAERGNEKPSGQAGRNSHQHLTGSRVSCEVGIELG